MTRALVILLSLTFASFVQAQEIVTTVAGSPFVFPVSVNGGPATAAPLREVYGVAVDSDGNVYASDALDHIVMKISTRGTLTIVAGNGMPGFSGDGGPAASATLSRPTGLTVDPSGNLYIADTGNYRVRKVGSDGIIATVAGTGPGSSSSNRGDGEPATQAYLSLLMGVAMDARGNLYIAEYGISEVRVVDSAGIIHTFAGGQGPGFSGDGGPAINAQLDNHWA